MTIAGHSWNGYPLREILLTVPLNYRQSRSGHKQNSQLVNMIPLFARLITPKGVELDRVHENGVVLYLQGGPGFPSPRPPEHGSLLKKLLEKYSVVLLDQRGTGRSGRIDKITGSPTAEELECYRADSIVEDAEILRQHLGIDKWMLFGQSFGGFCINTYLSKHPESVEAAMLTGGLPGVDKHADDVYRATFSKLRARHDLFYRKFPQAEATIREVCAHLDQSDECLPTGERLSSRRFRTIGIELGRGAGFDTLGYLLEDPFVHVRGEKRLRGDFLASVGSRVSFEAGPLYAVIHEAIYGGSAPGATNWSAHRIREESPGFEEGADPRSSDPFYLTGEHIFPWQFDEDPALHCFKGAAEELAQKSDWGSLYDPQRISSAEVKAAAAIYVDDIFVPMEFSLETASLYRDLRPFITNEFQHDGIREDANRIVGRLFELLEVH